MSKPRFDVSSLTAGQGLSASDEQRAKGRTYKRERSRFLDGVPIINVNFRLERSRVARIKAHCVEQEITQEEFFDDILRQAGF